MLPEEYIKSQFSLADVTLHEIQVLRFDEKSFGNFVARVDSSIGTLQLIRDKGQTYVDVWDAESGQYVRAERRHPSVLGIYEKGHWELWQVLVQMK